MSRAAFARLISVSLLGLTILALFAAAKTEQGRDLSQVLWLLSGMLAAGFFQSLTEATSQTTFLRSELSFNPELSRKALERVTDAEFVELEAERPLPSWELTSDELLRRDPPLALARLRIELERELRRLTSPLNLPSRLRLSQMIHLLLERRVIPAELASAMRDIIPAANNAAHGNEIPFEQANALLDLGDEVLRLLRSIPEERVKDSLSSARTDYS